MMRRQMTGNAQWSRTMWTRHNRDVFAQQTATMQTAKNFVQGFRGSGYPIEVVAPSRATGVTPRTAHGAS